MRGNAINGLQSTPGAHQKNLAAEVIHRDLKSLGICMPPLPAKPSRGVYVDDFVGSGSQLSEAREYSAGYVVGTFSEFVLAPCICEEGRDLLEERGIEVFSGHIHTKAERPLHEESTLLNATVKSRMLEVCEGIDGHAALGFKSMAVMAVLYRNAPDNVPVLLRGSTHQAPYVGVFPRTTDMPIDD